MPDKIHAGVNGFARLVLDDDKKPDIVFRTPNPLCPSCAAKRLHTASDWQEFHPQAGQGIDGRRGK